MKIACIGNITYDLTVIGEEFIKENQRNNFYESTETIGGPASNAASVLTKFGNNVDFYGEIGNDVYGKFIFKELKKENINLNHLNISNSAKTPFSFIIANLSNATRTISTIRNKTDYINPVITNIKYENNYDYILTDGKYPTNTLELIKKNPNALTIIDAGRVNDEIVNLCKYIDYIICSEDFANTLTGIEMSEKNENKNDFLALYKLREIFPNAKGIAITLGHRGYICEQNGQIILNPAYEPSKKIIDTNAAGDIFHGAFTHALANGKDFFESLEFANITASLSTTKVGGRNSIPELEEVQNINKNIKKILKKD